MKTLYKLQASRKTLIRWAAQEVGIHNAKRMIDDGSALRIFGAINGAFKTKKAAEGVARRIEMMSAFVAGKLGKKDYECVLVIKL
jgi:hypothetical protein